MGVVLSAQRRRVRTPGRGVEAGEGLDDNIRDVF